jgi:hypothetical protein
LDYSLLPLYQVDIEMVIMFFFWVYVQNLNVIIMGGKSGVRCLLKNWRNNNMTHLQTKKDTTNKGAAAHGWIRLSEQLFIIFPLLLQSARCNINYPEYLPS